jgi:uncharacterized membrane protein YwzB
MNGEVRQKLKEWTLALIVPLMFVAAWWSVQSVNNEQQEQRLKIQCLIQQQNIEQLRALKQIARELGLPGNFEIPPRSAECAASDGQ